MSILQSIFLGIVQGLTEFLPVSSSGHLSIMKNVFRINTGTSLLYDVLLHIGTLVVVIYVYRKDVGRLILEFFSMCQDIFTNFGVEKRNKNAITLEPRRRIIKNNYRKFIVLILISTIPTGLIGVLGKKLISDASDTLIIPGICLLVTAALLLISDKAPVQNKIPKDVTYREAIIIGIAQGLATLPGLSRSGTTIAVCLLCGLDRAFAVKYSFILSIPAVLGAALLELKDLGSESITPEGVGIYFVGMLAAAVVGYFCIRFLQKMVQQKKFRYFAYYCMVVGVVAIVGQFVLM